MDARKWLKKRTKVQIFLATIMLSTSISTTFLSIATQQFAKSQNYHPALNQISSPIIGHYYNPLAIAAWKKQYYEQAKEDFDIVMPKIYLGFGIGVIILFAGVLILKGKKTALTTHGSARWATEEELDQTGLTKPEGVMLGVTKGGKYIRHNGAEHIICYAPTRCLIEDTKIVVKHHHIIYDEEIKNLKKGMSVWTGHEWSKVIWHKKTKRPKQAVKLTFENGKEEICTINHKWPTTNGMVMTENLLVGDQLLEIACNPFDVNESMEDFDKKFLEAFKNKKTTKPIKIISIESIITDKDFYNITIKDEPHIYMLSSGVYTGNSGKGVGIIIPTLLAWKHSVVVTDIKGENWGITSGYRKAKLNNKVIKFDPTCVDGSGARFNPLEEIRVGTPDEVKDTQRIVTMIVDTAGKGELDHWGKTASALLLGLILYVLYCEDEKNLSRVADIINNPEEEDIGESLRMMAERNHADPSLMKQLYGVETGVHPKIWNSLLECSNKPDNERGSVISTAVSNLALYRDPIIKHNISQSDFKIRDLMNYDTPVSLYIVIPPSDLDRVVPLTRIIINQIITSLTEKMEFVDGKPVVAYKHKLLLLIDEFPAFGKIESLEKALAFIAGYGLKALLIIQSLNQINKAYTKDNSILDNCHIRIAYTPNDNHTAEEISKSLGESTILVDSYGYDKGFNFMGPRKTGRSGQSRKLMTAGEVMVMPPDDEIVFVAGFPPYKAKKIFYWKDHNFKKRLLSAPPKSDVTQYRPEAEEGEDDVTLSMSGFRNDLSEIAMSIDDLPPMMQHPFNSQPNMLVEPEIEAEIPDTHDYDNIEMIQRLLNNAPTDESRENAINNNSFVDSYDDLAYIDFDQLEREADEIAVM